MKKNLFIFLSFISIFMFFDKVNAADDYNPKVQDNFIDYFDNSHDIQKDLDNIINIAKEKNIDLLLSTIQYTSDDKGYGCYDSPKNTKCSYIRRINIYVFKGNNNHKFEITQNGIFRPEFSGFYKYSLNLTINNDHNINPNYLNEYNSLINYLNNKDYSAFTNDNSRYLFAFNTTSRESIYDTTYKSYLFSVATDKNYTFLSNKLKSGDLIPSYKNYVMQYYEVNLSNLNYSAIEVKFKISDFSMVDQGNDFNIDYSISLDNNMIIPLLPIPQERIYRNLSIDDYKAGTTVNLLFDNKDNVYTFKGLKHYDYWNTVTYRFEFPFTTDYVGNISFKFWSDANYEVILEKRDDEDKDIKYTKIDLTNKYGVGFIPKVKNTTINTFDEFYGIFKIPLNNNYRLLFYKNYENINKKNNKNNLILDKVILSLENFEYKFTKDNMYSYLLFINNNFESGKDASIYYNSNYFNYCILDTNVSSCNIINPNIKDEIVIDPNLSDIDNFGLKDIFGNFSNFTKSTNFILNNITVFYNDYLVTDLKAFFYIVFGFSVIIIVMKIVL